MRVFLCDLSHTAQGYASEMIPYPVGCIKSYALAHSRVPVEIDIFKHPEKMGAAFLERRPAIVGFSCYMWNHDLSRQYADAIKRLAAETLIVFGGPSFPLEVHRKREWLERHPMVDLYVEGEGEQPFLDIVHAFAETGDIGAVKRAGINAVHALDGGALLHSVELGRDGFAKTPRIAQLDGTPSPYLEGHLDEFLADPALVPLMESNRGCPFTCTYCVDGNSARGKVYKASPQRLKDELTYIARRYKGKTLALADTNFGMYREDVEFAKAIAETRRQYGFPQYINVSTGKNHKERIVECAELLGGALRVAASVQSLDQGVLANVRRSNISQDQLIEVSERLSDGQSHTYSELILSLPGDSRDKHISSLHELVRAGFNQIRMHTLVLLPGSVLGTDAERAKYRLRTRYRLLQRCFGAYAFGDRTIRSTEVEEVCVEQDTLPFADYLFCRTYNLTVALFYNERIFHELSRFLGHKRVGPARWLEEVHRAATADPGVIGEVYRGFRRDTENELYATEEELHRLFRHDDAFFRSCLHGERGNNLLFNTQADVFAHHVAELHHIAFAVARRLLGPLPADEDLYLSDLERFCILRKRDFTDVAGETAEDFSFDLTQADAWPPVRCPTRIRFFHAAEQRELITDQLRTYGRSPQGLGKIFARSPVKNMHRHVARV